MKVILLEKVPGLGDIDTIKDVADGYAKNFLFPRHLAVLASPKALADLKSAQHRKEKEAEMDLRVMQSLASRLDGLVLTLTEKTNEAGFLYAAVGPQKIADILEAQGFNITKNQVMTKPLKETGEFPVVVKFRHGLEAKLSVIINPIGKKEETSLCPVEKF